MRRRSTLFLFLSLVLSLAFLLNGFMAWRTTRPTWPGDIARHHRSMGVNLDLQELAALNERDLARRWQHVREDGATLVRLRVPWDWIQPEPDTWRWQDFDRILASAPHELSFVLTLDGSPAWARAAEDMDNPFAPPVDVRDFGRFAEEIARRAPSDRILAYQIWHEPNIGPHWGARYANPQEYFNLLREASNRIRAERPQATMMLASLAPTTTHDGFNMPEYVYLDRLLSLGAAEFFDLAAGQAYGFSQPPEAAPSQDQLNFRRVELLREVLVRHGLTDTPIYITAWGWWTPQQPELDLATSPWGGVPVASLPEFQRRGWDWAQAHWPWAAGLTWVQYVAAPDESRVRLGWVTRDAAGQRTPAGKGLAMLQNAGPIFGAGAYNPGSASDRQSMQFSPAEGWHLSSDAADPQGSGVEMQLRFRGQSVAVRVQRGPYKGYMYVWIDDQPAPDLPVDPATGQAYLLLYDPDNGVETVPIARKLPPGDHVLRIEAQGGWGRWPLRRIVVADHAQPTPWPFWPIVSLLTVGLLASGWALLRSLYTASHAPATARPPAWARHLIRLAWLIGAWMPLLALMALPFYMRPLRLGPIGLPLHELFIWLGFGAVVAGLLLARVFQDDGPSPHRIQLLHLDIPVLLLLLFGFFATLAARQKGYAFYDWRVTFLTPTIFYALISRVTLRHPQGLQRLAYAALIGGVLVSGIALGQFLFGRYGMAEGLPRVQAFYGSANNLALVLGRLFPLALALTFLEKGRKRWGFGLALAAIALAGFLTFSKGLLFISMPIGMLVLAVMQPRLRKPLLVLALLGALALLPFLNTPRLAQITSGTGRFRLYLWQSAWRMWLDHPWLGVGPDNFLYAYRSFYVLPAAWEELNLSHPHNLFFDLLTRVGILGFFAGMGLVVGTIWEGFRRLRRKMPETSTTYAILLGLWAGFIAGMAHGMIDNSLFLPDLMTLSLLVTASVGAFSPSTT